ncbi:MAG: tetratricopeptide repeat protein [Chloroherpetonaceae bacterium]
MKKPLHAVRKEIDCQLREASLLRLSNPRKAEHLCKEALKCADDIGDNRRAAKAKLMLATLAFDKSDFDSLEMHCRDAMRLAPKRRELLGDCEVLLGLAQWQKGNHPNALAHYLSAISRWKESTLKRSEIQRRTPNVFVNIGHLYVETGNYEKALDYYFKALSLLDEQTDTHTRSTIQRSIGSVYEYLQDFERAIEFFRQSLDIVRETKNAIGESVTRYNLGNTLWLKGCLNESLIELERACDLAKATGDRRVEVATLVIHSAVFADLNEKEKFNSLTETLLENVDALKIADMRAKSRLILAKSFMKMNEPQKALLLFNEAISLSQAHNIPSVEAEVQQELSKYYESLGDFKQSFSCFKNAVEILERQRTAEAKQKLAMYEVERRVSVLEAERQRLESEVRALRRELNKKSTLTKKQQEQLLNRLQVVNPEFSKRLKQHAPTLSPAELKIAHLIRGAMATKEIASALQVSPRTIETHRENLRKKLGLKKAQLLNAVLQTL